MKNKLHPINTLITDIVEDIAIDKYKDEVLDFKLVNHVISQ